VDAKLLMAILIIVLFSGLTCTDSAGTLSFEHEVNLSESVVILDGCDDFLYASRVLQKEDRVMKEPLYVETLPSEILDMQYLADVQLPAYFNWKDNEGGDWTTPAKNQGNCGSCWDFAACGAFESVIKIKEGNVLFNPDISEQYVLSCLPAAANNYGEGCLGGNPSNAYYYMLNETDEGNNINGVLLEECFPYQATHNLLCSEKCEAWEHNVVPLAGIGERWLGFDSPENRDILKTQLMQNGPVAAAMNVEAGFIEWGNSHHSLVDYFPDPEVSWRNSLNHIIVVVGWNDDVSIGNGGYWICKNSWGTAWGYGGFYNIEYGALFTGYLIAWAEYDPASFNFYPIADAGNFYQGLGSQPIQFIGTNSVDAEDAIISYHWDFGDGAKGTGPVVSHTYSQSGYYTATLTVIDDDNQSSIDTVLVGVDEPVITLNHIKGGIRFTFVVSNNQEAELTDLTWRVTFEGLLLGDNEREGTIYSLPGGAERLFEENLFGIGPGTATIDIEGVIRLVRILMLGPFVLVRQHDVLLLQEQLTRGI